MVDTDQTLVSVESVRERLLASVNLSWQQDVEQQLSQEHDRYQSYDDEYKFKLLLSYVLHTDMRHYWKAGREGEKPWFVQIEQVQDISQPVKRRLSKGSDDRHPRGGSRRMLKMVLYDGKKHHVGIEHASLGFGWPRLGSKLVLDPGLLVQEGVLMLTPKTCGFLGGSVKEFEEHQKHVDAVVQEPLYGRRGPPLKLDEYIKSLKEKIEQQQEEPEEQNRDAPAGSPAAVDPPPATGDIYIIPSESDDDWDIEALLEKKRTRNEVQVIDEEQQEQQQQQQQEEEQAPPAPVRADDTLASTLREMKRRREMRAKQQNTTV